MGEPANNPSLPLRATSLVDRMNIGIHTRRYFKLISRRWWILLLFTLIGTGIAAYKAFTLPDMYRAVTKIGVAPRLRTVYENRVQYEEALDNFYTENINLIKGVVEARVRNRASQASSLDKGPLLVTDAQHVASSFYLFADSTELSFARNYLTNWAREFIAYKNEMKDNTVAREAARTADEIARFSKRLEEARSAKDAFLRTNKIGSPQETGRAAQKRYEEAIDQLRRVQTALALEKQRSPQDIAEGATGSAGRPSSDGDRTSQLANEENGDPLARFAAESKYSELKLRLRAEQAEIDRLSGSLRTNHPYMRQLLGKIDLLKEGLAHQLDLIQEKRDARIKFLDQQEASFSRLVAELLKDVQAKSSIQYEHERLLKEEATIEKHLEDLRKQLLSFDPSAIDESQFNIIEEGVQQRSPLDPNRRKLLLQGLFFGLISGLGLVYLLHRLDDRLELAQDIEKALQEPVLGQIPEIADSPGHPLLLTEMDQYSLFAESIRGVRSAILLGSGGAKKQVLLVTSAVPGDGKTTFTVNFAVTLALAGNKVLLVDSDLRRGTAHQFFKQERQNGLSDVLAGELHWHDVVAETSVAGLSIIRTGRLPANPGELLISPITREFIEQSRAEYDYIIFDCPPLTAIDDTFSLVSLADGLLFVVRAGQTSIRFARNALAAVRHRGAKVLGIVLNGITADNPYYYYNSYYHSYYKRTDQQSATLTAAAPGTKMAEARKSRLHPHSIAAEAQVLSGNSTPAAEVELSKTEQYRALRAQRLIPPGGHVVRPSVSETSEDIEAGNGS